MNSVVIYGSRYGNTRKIAEAIADQLRTCGTVSVMSVDEAPGMLPERIDLVVIGGPTEAHSMTKPVGQFFDRLEPGALRGVAAAAFDTRFRMARWLTGSAAVGITRKLRRCGARMVASEESFYVKRRPDAAKGDEPMLEPGELERAAGWAVSLADKSGVVPVAAIGKPN